MATLITKNSSTASAVPAAGDLVKGELAVNVTDKKVYTKDNSAAVVKLVGSLGNQEANAVAVTGGTINGTTIGATTPSTGAFTTASASSGFTGNLTGNVTGNVSGTAANVTGVVAIANGGTGLSALGTGVQSALGQAVTGSGSFVLSTSPSLTTPNLGTPSAAVLTNATGLPLTTGVTGTLGVANGGTGITAFGTGVATALGQNVTGSGGIVLATSPVLTTPNLGTPSAATLTNATGLPISTGVSGLGTNVATALAVNVGTAGAFVVNGGALGTPSSGTLTNATGLPISTGVSGLGTGVATALAVNTGSAGAFVVNGGALGTPSSGTLTNATGLPLSTGVTGTLATTNGGTGLTSFTANGVVYASSSSALTTGSALTFDGAKLGLQGLAYIQGSPSFPSTGVGLELYYSSGASSSFIQSFNRTAGTYTDFGFVGKDFVWNPSGSEQMRLTSTGLGIGTSSPGRKLHVAATGTSYIARFESTDSLAVVNFKGSATGDFTVGAGANGENLVFLTSTTERARIDSSGNVGIGTSSPGALLHIKGSSNPAIYWENSTFGTAKNAVFMSSSGQLVFGRAGVTDWMTLDSSGNLGLGVTPSAWSTSVQTALQVYTAGVSGNGGGNTASRFTHGCYLDGSTWKYQYTGVAPARYEITGPNAGSTHSWSIAAGGTAGDPISFTQAMTLDASGRLGIGATSPTQAISISRGAGNAAFLAVAANGNTLDSTDVLYGQDTSSQGYFLNRANAALIFGTNNAERARITSGGYSKFSNDGSYVSSTGAYHEMRQTASDWTVRVSNTNATPYGILVPQTTDINNTGSEFLYCQGAATLRASIRSNGGLANYQSNNVDLSDARTKKEITPAPSYWDKIGALEIVTYKYNDQTHDDVNVGVIAQQVESVEPVWVDADGFGEAPEDGVPLKTVYTKDITFAAIKALQEAMARIEQLEAKVAALEAK